MSTITIKFTNATRFTIRFAFGDGQMQMTYTMDGTIQRKTNDKKANGTRPYLFVPASDNYQSIHMFSEFANSILSRKSASLTNQLHYDASMHAIILIARGSYSLFDNTPISKGLIQFTYCLNNNTDDIDKFISQLNHINAEIESSTPIYYPIYNVVDTKIPIYNVVDTKIPI